MVSTRAVHRIFAKYGGSLPVNRGTISAALRRNKIEPAGKIGVSHIYLYQQVYRLAKSYAGENLDEAKLKRLYFEESGIGASKLDEQLRQHKLG